MICGKCFRALPAHVKLEHRQFWKEIRSWQRRIARTQDELKIVPMKRALRVCEYRLSEHWDQFIKGPLVSGEKPEGLDGFLEEMGMI